MQAILPMGPNRAANAFRFTPRPREVQQRVRSLIDVTLDPAQEHAARRPAGGAMLVLGEAGHGKTTVALHRLAHLYARAKGRFRAVVLVPSEGLRRLLQPLVTRLGADVVVMTYDAWAVRQAKRAFGDLPRRVSRTATVGVLRVKRDPALRPLLEEIAKRAPGVIDEDFDAPPAATKAWAHRGDLQHLFGDSAAMRRLAGASAQGIPAHAVAEVLEHTHVQFSQRSEKAYAHVDRERLVTVDAHALDRGTPNEDARSFDAEDAAVLFELDRMRALVRREKPTQPRAFDCIVVDEAQELAPLELALIGRSLAPGGTLVVAGDADQQIDPTACFGGWDAAMEELRQPRHERVVLEVGYRCSPPIAAFARSLREGNTPRRGDVPLLGFDDEPSLAAFIAREANRLERLDPKATVCVLLRTVAHAKSLADALKGKVPRRLVLGGDFVFHRGVDVTTTADVKGLEFDYVVVADAGRAHYADDAASRRALYVAVTRARSELALLHVGPPSPLAAEGT